MSTRTLLVLVLAAAFCVSALAAGMIVSPGALMGVNQGAGGSGPPVEPSYRITQAGDNRVTEAGDNRVIVQ